MKITQDVRNFVREPQWRRVSWSCDLAPPLRTDMAEPGAGVLAVAARVEASEAVDGPRVGDGHRGALGGFLGAPLRATPARSALPPRRRVTPTFRPVRRRYTIVPFQVGPRYHPTTDEGPVLMRVLESSQVLTRFPNSLRCRLLSDTL